MTISAGTALAGRWHLTSPLASGGMADVYLAHDLDEDLEVAVKLLRGGVTDGARRFASEVAVLERLHHPHIVSLLGAGDHEGTPYLVMALVGGPSLAQRLHEGPLEMHEVQRIGTQVAEALAYAHAHDVVHRDIKPSNVLFDPSGRAYLADFGIARLADASSITATGTTVGSASYVAPEQLTDREAVGPAADVYSLGLVLLESVTGRRSFEGPPTAAAMARLSREPEIPDVVPPAWRRLLRSMTAREPAARPSAAQAADLLATGVPLDRTDTLVLPETPQAAQAGEGPPAHDASTQPFDVPTEAADGRDLGTAAPYERATAPSGHVTTPSEHATAPSERRRPPTRQDGRPRRSGLRVMGVSMALVALLAVAVVAAMAAGEGDAADDAPPHDAPTTDLPQPLDDAFRRLHEEVQP